MECMLYTGAFYPVCVCVCVCVGVISSYIQNSGAELKMILPGYHPMLELNMSV